MSSPALTKQPAQAERNQPLQGQSSSKGRKVQKVHVTLRAEVCASPAALQETLQHIERVAGLVSQNTRRVERYGILSGEMDAARIPDLEAVQGVQSVSLDELQRAL
ncbi:hypothetical protein EHF33_17115 (plasmid) [Deinococcus psychrotolerans]|uniref:Uncharacterized protein n=1 Tax=Deinococcus psychrotolerans TaxID=2489213 RepID=A0A3G8YH21_9DEIO|nr:hypothetical protein [Deinococcus psychrotolerans]AZI44619.1 hypothetical protein EHF33_17115 [Deinococcus psychrotolerans]